MHPIGRGLMSRHVTKMLKTGLSALYYSRAGELLAPLTRGSGVVFMMHRVSPQSPEAFEPNRILRVTPDFLERTVRQVIERGFDCISLDEVPERLAAAPGARPFACFTFDDGYRDNLDYAFPILQRYRVPHTLYIPTEYPEGRGDLWWLVLESAIRLLDHTQVVIDGETMSFPTATVAEKDRAYNAIYWRLRNLPEYHARVIVAELAQAAGFDAARLCSDLILGWDELREAVKDPLLSIGAHTCNHLALSKLDAADAYYEMSESRARIERELGTRCDHFSYPYGCEMAAGPREFELARQLGYKTAVTTRKGMVQRGHVDELTAIPRLSLNGDFQSQRYVDVMLSGLPFAMWNAARRVMSPALA